MKHRPSKLKVLTVRVTQAEYDAVQSYCKNSKRNQADVLRESVQRVINHPVALPLQEQIDQLRSDVSDLLRSLDAERRVAS